MTMPQYGILRELKKIRADIDRLIGEVSGEDHKAELDAQKVKKK